MRDVQFLRANTERKIKITLPGPFTMTQQAQDDYYKDEEALAMAYAAAVNAELKDLKRGGADVLQLDEPWLQARAERAGRYGVKAINRALEGIEGTTIVHLCFGYAAAVKDKPSGYSFLAQLAETKASQISIEAAQPHLDLAITRELAPKQVMVGVIDLGTEAVETAGEVAGRRARLRHEISVARRSVRQIARARRRRGDGSKRDWLVRQQQAYASASAPARRAGAAHSQPRARQSRIRSTARSFPWIRWHGPRRAHGATSSGSSSCGRCGISRKLSCPLYTGRETPREWRLPEFGVGPRTTRVRTSAHVARTRLRWCTGFPDGRSPCCAPT